MTLREDVVALMADGQERTLRDLVEALPAARNTMGARIAWMFARDMLTRRQITVRRTCVVAKGGDRPRSVWTYKLVEAA